MKKMTKLGLSLAISALTVTALVVPATTMNRFASPVEATAKQTVKKKEQVLITTSGLNLRTGASVKHKVIKVIPKAKEVTLLKKSGSWSQVRYGKTSGWVNASYLKPKGVSVVKSTKTVKTPGYPAPVSKIKGAKYAEGVLIVNKQFGLPSTYNPGVNPLAKKAAQDMTLQAKKKGITLKTISEYRSYSYQAQLFKRYSNAHGVKKAERFSARPGHSEHQTGLAFDFGGTNQKYWLESSFGKTAEGKWLANNAHTFGFVLRYPQNKENMTGYMYEPWHFRYVGSEMATKIKKSGLTMEEYFKLVKK